MEHALISLVILIFSAIVHEVSHGLAAEKFGDDTAREEGRITLNPLPHIDPFGSILLPLILLMAGSPVVLGAAKPVPVNFSNLRPLRLGMVVVGLSGVFANLFLAILGAVIIKLGLANSLAMPILLQFIIINLVLAVFNILPIPPLDGSKVLAALGNRDFMYRIFEFERYGFILIFLFLLMGWLNTLLVPVIVWFFKIFNLTVFL